jgi:hypothetical protein
MQDFDKDMLRIMRYHRKLVKLCRIYVAIQADGELFDRIAPKQWKGIKDNQRLRWLIGDEMLELLWRNGDWRRQTIFRKGKNCHAANETTGQRNL